MSNEETDWISLLSDRGAESYAIHGADFAEALWSGDVSVDAALTLLRSHSPSVRSAVAWAIADSCKSGRMADALLEAGLIDSEKRVRLYAIQLARRSEIFTLQERRSYIIKFLTDKDGQIKSVALKALGEISGGPKRTIQ